MLGVLLLDLFQAILTVEVAQVAIEEVEEGMVHSVTRDRSHSQLTSQKQSMLFLAVSHGSSLIPSLGDGLRTTPRRTRAFGAYPTS